MPARPSLQDHEALGSAPGAASRAGTGIRRRVASAACVAFLAASCTATLSGDREEGHRAALMPCDAEVAEAVSCEDADGASDGGAGDIQVIDANEDGGAGEAGEPDGGGPDDASAADGPDEDAGARDGGDEDGPAVDGGDGDAAAVDGGDGDAAAVDGGDGDAAAVDGGDGDAGSGRLPLAGVSNLNTRSFEALVGIPIRVWGAFSADKTWGNLDGSVSYLKAIRGYRDDHPDGTIVLSYSLYPDGTVDGVPHCAAGDYQPYYVSYGRALARMGIDGIVIRIGWEWNQWFSWGRWVRQDYDTRAPIYAQCFRNIVDGMRQGYPGSHLRFDWNSTEEVTLPVLMKGYPGDAYVDLITVEGYDNQGSKTDLAARWDALRPGLDVVAAFARTRGKPTGIGEWGVTRDLPWLAGDNPHYLEQLCKWVKDPGNNVLYYIYFNQLTTRGEDYRLASYPLSLAAYQQHCVGASTAVLP